MEEKKGSPSQEYGIEFKAEVLRMVTSGQAVADVSKALGVSENLIYRWKQKTEEEDKVGPETDSPSLSVENQQLKERMRQLGLEREVKKSLDHL